MRRGGSFRYRSGTRASRYRPTSVYQSASVAETVGAPALRLVEANPAIVLENVSFSYPNGYQALRSISLEIPRGRSVGIVGPSGCGKSTLLALLAGFYQPSGGKIFQTQFDVARHPQTMVFQKDTLLPWLTTVQNVKLFYKFHRGVRAEIDARVAELIQLAALDGFEKSYPYQLSGGMRRRVAFLSAVAPMPERLLLDEPFGSLDEPTRVAIHQDVLKIIRRLNITVVLVTHDLAEAISLCDEVVILTRGPGTLFSSHTIPFGRERDLLELRQTPEFLRLYGILWHELSLQLRHGPGVLQ